MTKILNHINTYADLTAYNNDLNKDFPNISYIQGSDEVKWYKYDPEYIVCKYYVSSTSSATKLLNSDTDITYQIIDGVQQDTVQMNYTFDTRGEHIVKYKLSGTSIGTSAFVSCTRLTSITIPSGVTTIGNNVFQGCTGLTSVTIPNSVTSIGSYAFENCTVLTLVTIPDSVTTIGERAFYACKGLTSINIPSGVTSIADFTFNQCSSLTSVTIPDSVTTIGKNSFYNCSGLTSITVEATTPPTLSSGAFSKTNENLVIYVPAESVDAYKTNWSSYASRIQAISE